MKHFVLISLLLPFLALTACNKSSSDSAAVTAPGLTGAYGTVTTAGCSISGTITMNPVCGTTGTINVYSVSTTGYGYSGSQGAMVGSAAVVTGGTFSFPLACGNYGITVTAGSCTFNTSSQQSTYNGVPTLTTGQQGYIINIYAPGQYSKLATDEKAASSSKSNLSYNYTGTGQLAFDQSIVFLSTKKETTFGFIPEATASNTMLNTNPSAKVWTGTVAADGKMKINGNSYDRLSYAAQVDADLLQYADGFCDTSSAAVEKMADYLTQAGFSAKTVAAMKVSWGQQNTLEKVCIYPQTSLSIEKVVTYKADTAVNANRVWFVVADESQVSAANGAKKLPEKVAKLMTRPTTDAVTNLKKNPIKRKIASDSDVLAEEYSFGFVIQK